MGRTTWVIQVLDDSNRRSIGYENRFWLRKHVEKLNIRVCVEDCNVDLTKIEESCKDKNTMIVQEGKILRVKSDFDSKKEALVLLKSGYGYMAFQYFPKA